MKRFDGILKNMSLPAVGSVLLVGVLTLVLGLWLLFDTPRSYAQEDEIVPTGNNAFCVICHTEDTARQLNFADGFSVPIAVDTDILANSVHGEGNPEGALGCVDCHGADFFPHDDPPAASFREHQISTANLCIRCHEDHAENLADDVHYTALVAGNLRAATCVDCHGGHDIHPPNEPRQLISETCGDCHPMTFAEYEDSVHGQALFNEADPNVPTCVDCHGVHGINHPTTGLFRNRSPELCADCHNDDDMMEQYGISTNVFESYLTDFHGTTVGFFDQSDPNVASNKAVCYDCHGVHDITAADEEKSQVVRENLLDTCRECHPDATADFPDSWVGHYEPTFEDHPFLTAVNVFYALIVPMAVGGFIFLVGTDIFRMIRNFFRRD